MNRLIGFFALMAVACGNSNGSPSSGGGAAGGAGGVGGSGPSVGQAGVTCDTDYDRIAAQTEPARFRADVMPVFTRACAGTSCHCNRDTNPRCYASGPQAGLFLGAASNTGVTVEEVADAVHANLVGVESLTAAGVLRIAPNDPGASFLIQKISDTHEEQGHTCTPQDPGVTGCGDPMPPGGDKITLCTQGDGNQEEFDLIARWVAQGAAND